MNIINAPLQKKTEKKTMRRGKIEIGTKMKKVKVEIEKKYIIDGKVITTSFAEAFYDTEYEARNDILDDFVGGQALTKKIKSCMMKDINGTK